VTRQLLDRTAARFAGGLAAGATAVRGSAPPEGGQPVRVLFWSGTFWPNIGGVEVLAARLLPALQSRGHQFAVIAPASRAEAGHRPPFRDIVVHRFAFFDGSMSRNIDAIAATRQEVCRIKRDFRPDLIHVNAIDAGVFFHLVTWHVSPAPMLVTLHGRWNNLTASQNSLISSTLRKAHWISGCSQDILDYGLKFAPEAAGRCSVIYNGISPSAEAPSPLEFDPPTVLCLGRLAREKGFDLVLQAVALICSRFPRLRVVIAGHGEQRATLERLAEMSGLARNVTFIGWVRPDNVPALINSATVVVMPSRQESFPLVALEAGMMARPVIAARVGGVPELVQDDETGLLVESENSAALAEAIASLLEDPAKARRLGWAARQRVQEKFSWQAHVDAYDCLYRWITANTLPDARDRERAGGSPILRVYNAYD
jgi:glycogen(starch) synthase